jgi:molybdopterin molybdotransferase
MAELMALNSSITELQEITMPEFLKVKTAEEVIRILRELQPLDSEQVNLERVCNRVLASPVSAPEPVPHFARSVMDGFAVRAKDTFGASESMPALLEVAGEVAMGESISLEVKPGKAIAVPTGGMLPAGADAVVMVEYTSALDEKTIEVSKPVAPGDNVLMRGEDIREEEVLFPAGCQLRSQDVGMLAALGLTTFTVHRRPRVAIISTGDEVVPVSMTSLPPGKVRDINSFGLAALVEEAGGVVGSKELAPDDLVSLVTACRNAMNDHDVVILSGGSSVGARDFTLRILEHFEDAELLVHGVAIRPGKPTILGKIGKKVFWGLPGHPVSAMMICKAFVQPSLFFLQGLTGIDSEELIGTARSAVLSRQLPSVHGRTDFVPVVLSKDQGVLSATPIFGKSAMISILAKADGFVIVPEHVEGLDRDTDVTVYLFSQRLQARAVR